MKASKKQQPYKVNESKNTSDQYPRVKEKSNEGGKEFVVPKLGSPTVKMKGVAETARKDNEKKGGKRNDKERERAGQFLRKPPILPLHQPLSSQTPCLHPEHCLADILMPRVAPSTVSVELRLRQPHDVLIAFPLNFLLVRLVSSREFGIFGSPLRTAIFLLGLGRWREFPFSQILDVPLYLFLEIVEIVTDPTILWSDIEVAEVASTAFAKAIGVVCRRCVGDTDWSTDVRVA